MDYREWLRDLDRSDLFKKILRNINSTNNNEYQAANRAILLGGGNIFDDSGHFYRLPNVLANFKDSRALFQLHLFKRIIEELEDHTKKPIEVILQDPAYRDADGRFIRTFFERRRVVILRETTIVGKITTQSFVWDASGGGCGQFCAAVFNQTSPALYFGRIKFSNPGTQLSRSERYEQRSLLSSLNLTEATYTAGIKNFVDAVNSGALVPVYRPLSKEQFLVFETLFRTRTNPCHPYDSRYESLCDSETMIGIEYGGQCQKMRARIHRAGGIHPFPVRVMSPTIQQPRLTRAAREPLFQEAGGHSNNTTIQSTPRIRTRLTRRQRRVSI